MTAFARRAQIALDPKKRSGQKFVRVLVADDSAAVRQVLVSMFNDDPEMLVVGEAADGRETVEKAQRLRPDLITMDVAMPAMDGVEATRRIMASCPTPVVILSAIANSPWMPKSFTALEAGAVDVLEKPDGLDFEQSETLRDEFLAHLKSLAASPLHNHVRRPAQPTHDEAHERSTATVLVAEAADAPHDRCRVIAIGASTGGPPAVLHVLRDLDPDTTPPILLVHHMAAGFMQGFVDWLDNSLRLRVVLAHTGARLQHGHVYVSPENWHMELAGGCSSLRLHKALPVNYHRPSVDVLFRSVAKHAGRDAVGVLLTGMGEDGARGLLEMRQRGALTLAQDEASSLVFGMPGAAIEMAAAAVVADPADIAAMLDKVGREIHTSVERP